MGRAILNIVDYDSDRQQVSFETVDTELDGTTFAADYTAAIALNNAILAIIIGNAGPFLYQAVESGSTPPPPVDIFAQVNIQWIFEFTDDVTGQKRTTRVGTADLDLATEMYNGAPSLPLGSGVGATLKTAFEANVRNGGNDVTLVAVFYKE